MLRTTSFTTLVLVSISIAGCATKAAKPVPAPSASIAPPSGGVAIGQTVTLDGSGSSDPQKRAIGFGWELIARPASSDAVLAGSDTATASLTPDVVGNYQVRLVVTNAAGVSSAPAYTNIVAATCGSVPLGTPQVSVGTIDDPEDGAIANGKPNAGSRVTLTAPVSDPNTACGSLVSPMRYEWTILSAPAGSHATLDDAHSATPSFVTDVQGSYQVSVAVTDALGNSSGAPGVIDVNTTTCGANPPQITLTPLDSSVSSSAPVPLSLSVSTRAADATTSQACPARFAVSSYTTHWSVTNAPVGGDGALSRSVGTATAALGDASVFSASVAGAYQVHASAVDANGQESDPLAGYATITVSSCGSQPPVINAIALVDAGTGATISNPAVGETFDVVAAVSDPNAACGAGGGLLTSLKALSLPSGSVTPITLGPISSTTFAITPDVYGSYQYELTVTNVGGRSSSTTFTIQTATCAPVAPALTPRFGSLTPVIGSNEQIIPSDVPFDACVPSPTFTYSWSLPQRPAASQAFVSGSTSSIIFSPDVIGTYVVQLVVTDQAGLSSTPVTLSLNAVTCETSPASIGALAASPTVPAPGGLVTLSAPNIVAPGGSCSNSQLTPYRYQWTLLSKPAGSSAVLSSESDAAPSFVADVPSGTWEVALTITDQLGNSSPASFLSITSSN